VTMATFDEPVGVSPSSARPFDRVTASPNPFFRTTAVQFSLPVASEVKVNVYDVLGRQVRTLQSGRLPAGEHRIVWDGRDANGTSRGGGIYFVRVQVGDQIISTKVVQMQ
jgi:flagellar hook assembly protein FlgD